MASFHLPRQLCPPWAWFPVCLLFILFLAFTTTPGQKPDCPPLPVTSDPCAAIPFLQENITFLYQMIPLVHPTEVPSLQAQLCRLKATLQQARKDCPAGTSPDNLPPLVWSQCQIPELDRLFLSNPCLAAMVIDRLRQLPDPSADKNASPAHPETALRFRHLQSQCIPFWSRKLKTLLPAGSSPGGPPCPPASVAHSSAPDSPSGSADAVCLQTLTELIIGEFRFQGTHPDWDRYRTQLRRHMYHICPGLRPVDASHP